MQRYYFSRVKKRPYLGMFPHPVKMPSYCTWPLKASQTCKTSWFRFRLAWQSGHTNFGQSATRLNGSANLRHQTTSRTKCPKHVLSICRAKPASALSGSTVSSFPAAVRQSSASPSCRSFSNDKPPGHCDSAAAFGGPLPSFWTLKWLGNILLILDIQQISYKHTRS